MSDSSGFRSIRGKIGFWAGLCLALTGAVLIAYASVSLRDQAVESARERVLHEARNIAGRVQIRLGVALAAARTLAQAFSAVKDPDPLVPTDSLDRRTVMAMCKAVLARHAEFSGIFTVWEPDAFDGKDAEYAGTEGRDPTGRFVWNLEQVGADAFETRSMKGIGDGGAGGFYQFAKKSGQEHILDPSVEPVQGEEMLVASMVAPIRVRETFFGVVGIRKNLAGIQKLVGEADLHTQFKGDIAIISHNGTVVAAAGKPEIVGRQMQMLHRDWQEDLAYIQSGQEVFEDDEGRLALFVPIRFGFTDTPWAVNFNVPLKVIMKKADDVMWKMIGIGVSMVAAALALLWVAAGQIVRPIRHITDVARSISGGESRGAGTGGRTG